MSKPLGGLQYIYTPCRKIKNPIWVNFQKSKKPQYLPNLGPLAAGVAVVLAKNGKKKSAIEMPEEKIYGNF